MYEISCKCGWKGTEDDLVYNCIHAEAGRTVWCCPHCGNIFWDGKFLNVTADELNRESETGTRNNPIKAVA